MYKIVQGTSPEYVQNEMNEALRYGYYLVSFHTTVNSINDIDYCAVMEKK